MSAYIVQPEHAGLLAAWAVRYGCTLQELEKEGPLLTAQNVARELLAENIKSVAERYPDSVVGDRPGPNGLTDTQITEAAALWAGRYLGKGTLEVIAPAAIKSLADCLEYQSNEHDGFESSWPLQQLNAIRARAAHCPGQQATTRAPWSWSLHDPELDALIYGKVA